MIILSPARMRIIAALWGLCVGVVIQKFCVSKYKFVVKLKKRLSLEIEHKGQPLHHWRTHPIRDNLQCDKLLSRGVKSAPCLQWNFNLNKKHSQLHDNNKLRTMKIKILLGNPPFFDVFNTCYLGKSYIARDTTNYGFVHGCGGGFRATISLLVEFIINHRTFPPIKHSNFMFKSTWLLRPFWHSI